MAEQATEKLNNNYIPSPRAFYAKPKKDKDGKPIQGQKIAFKPSSGARRYNPSDLLIMGAINKTNVKYDGNVKHTYELLKKETGIRSDATVSESLSRLEKDGKIKFCGTSKYEIAQEFSARSYVIIYNFLLTEELDLGGKIKKHLSKNAAFLLSEIISFYLNENNKGKYFDGSEKAVGALLNVAPGTAGGIINELVKVGAVYTKIKTTDSAGNIMLRSGKGNSPAATTVLEINTDLKLRCASIKAEITNRRRAKDNAAVKPKQPKGDKKPNDKPKKPTKREQQRAKDLDILRKIYNECEAKESLLEQSLSAMERAAERDRLEAQEGATSDVYSETLAQCSAQPGKLKGKKRSLTEEWASTIAKLNARENPTNDPNCIEVIPPDDPPDDVK